MSEVCQQVKEWKVEELHLRKCGFYLDNNQIPTILQEIKDVRFPNLKAILLRGNMIESLEGLNRIVLPKLSWLAIGTDANILVKTISAASPI